MKRALLLSGLSGLLLFMSCEQTSSPSQNKFLVRLKQTQDTVDIFHNKEVLKNRVIGNLNRYVRDNSLTFTDWQFTVENIASDKVDLKSVGKGDSSVYGVKFAMLIPEDNAKVKDEIAKIKTGDVIKVKGELAMKTEDGKISMNSYFASDSTRFVKLVPTEIKH